jgi:hypothetical protein
VKQTGLFDPAEPAPDPVAREINELRKAVRDRVLEYESLPATSPRARTLDDAIRHGRERLAYLVGVRKRQEATRAVYAPVPPPAPRSRLRALPKVAPHDGRMAATGEREE